MSQMLIEKTAALSRAQIDKFESRNYRDDRYSIRELLDGTNKSLGKPGVDAVSDYLSAQYDLLGETGMKFIPQSEEELDMLKAETRRIRNLSPEKRKEEKDKFDNMMVYASNPGFMSTPKMQRRIDYNKWHYSDPSNKDINPLDFYSGIPAPPGMRANSPNSNYATNSAKKVSVAYYKDLLKQHNAPAVFIPGTERVINNDLIDKLDAMPDLDETKHPYRLGRNMLPAALGLGAVGAIGAKAHGEDWKTAAGYGAAGAGLGAALGGLLARAEKKHRDNTEPITEKEKRKKRKFVF